VAWCGAIAVAWAGRGLPRGVVAAVAAQPQLRLHRLRPRLQHHPRYMGKLLLLHSSLLFALIRLGTSGVFWYSSASDVG
jgi:hypothetical protein